MSARQKGTKIDVILVSAPPQLTVHLVKAHHVSAKEENHQTIEFLVASVLFLGILDFTPVSCLSR